ncbi:uncharacterized protein LOC134815718 [Bolinopsis microptera]|uniref:uncharacterized protein LOC134815718 n=1 Tax=Bolinopsis microptera TaxID=2820187 RepID=UPI003078AB43
MNHNPRKFEEKIALNKQKQAEQDKQFEDIIRDVSNIRDNECISNQFRSLPNIHGPPPGMYQYNMAAFNAPVNHQDGFWNADIHHGLNLQLPESHQRRVLSDSQLHKTGVKGESEGWNNHSLPRPKSALSVKSYENSISTKTSSLPDLSQNYIPVQDESYSQNILHQHYLDGIPDNLRMGGQHQYQVPPHQGGGYFMSIDEATGTDLKHRVRQYSPTPSPPATPQSMSYNFGSPNTNYQRMTAQMQEFNLHSPTGQILHSGNCSPHSRSGQASPDVYDIKPSIDDSVAAHQQYINYYPSQPPTPHEQQSYSNPPSIPKIQVQAPEEAMSPQYYPPDDEMSGAGMDLNEYFVNFEHDSILQGEDVQGSLDMYPSTSYQNYPYS